MQHQTDALNDRGNKFKLVNCRCLKLNNDMERNHSELECFKASAWFMFPEMKMQSTCQHWSRKQHVEVPSFWVSGTDSFVVSCGMGVSFSAAWLKQVESLCVCGLSISKHWLIRIQSDHEAQITRVIHAWFRINQCHNSRNPMEWFHF